ncbi:MAG TPA: hypothetical protein VFM79_05570 [Pelobium sp.]|nr:hypothetical protein [Pelobium sp.]
MYLKKATYQVISIPLPINGFRFAVLRVVPAFIADGIAAFILFRNTKDFIV